MNINDIICPMRLACYRHRVDFNDGATGWDPSCLRQRCAWWVSAKSCCTLVALADTAGTITDNMEGSQDGKA